MKVDKEVLNRLGIDKKITNFYDTIEDLRNSTPGMILTESKEDFSFSVNSSEPILWKKGTIKILSISLYLQMEKNKQTNKIRLRRSTTNFVDKYRPYQGQDLSGKKILIWRTGGLGDICFINPLMRYMKEKWPDCTIYFSCAPSYQPLIKNWDCIDEIVQFPVSFHYFNISDYHATFEGVIERCKEAETTNVYKLFSKWLNLTDISDDKLVPILTTYKECDDIVDSFLKDNDIEPYKFITVQLRASSPIRTPSSECWSNILIPLLKDGNKIVITDGPHISNRIDAFINLAIPEKYRKQCFNFSYLSTTIKCTISLINKSQMCIAPDSSVVHLSQGVECPVLGIYGAFPGFVRMDTYSNSDWVEPTESNICNYNGKYCCLHGQQCPVSKKGSTAPCYGYISYDEVYKKVCNLLQARENGYNRNQNELIS